LVHTIQQNNFYKTLCHSVETVFNTKNVKLVRKHKNN